jgi:hypothetical protein
VRRVLTGLVLALALAAPAIPAAADDQVPMDAPWGGSNVETPPPVTGPTTHVRIQGRIQNGSGRRDSVAYPTPAVTVTFDQSGTAGCRPAPAGPAAVATVSEGTVGGGISDGWKVHTYQVDMAFSKDTNGAYPVIVCFNGEPVLDTAIRVLLPAPVVTNVVATSAGHDVHLTWDDMRAGAPDVSGYRIERSVDGGPFEALATVGAEPQAFTDTTLPPEGGEASYQVISQRPFVSDAAPSTASSATFEPGPPTPGGDGGGTDAGGAAGGTDAGGDGGGTDTGGGADGGTGGGGSGRVRTNVNRGPTIRIPRVGSPSRSFFPALLAPPAMDTYSEQLPYDTPTGDDGSETIDDELASEPLEQLPGRGLAIPIATGLVLGVWALHLRFLARASRPGAADSIDILH